MPQQDTFEPLAHHPLRDLCTLRVGGQAEYFGEPATRQQLRQAVHWARGRDLALTILGGGSNVVLRDEGVPGLVLKLAFTAQSVEVNDSGVSAQVGSGVDWDRWVAHCVAKGWAGLECLSGIPGSVGATPIQNVGAYGHEVSQNIEAVDVYDLQRDSFRTMAAEECQFGYRTSLFKSLAALQFIVVGVRFALQLGPPAPVRNGELSRALLAVSATPTLREVRQTVLAVRAGKSMVLDASDPNTRSCGSFFLNPVVSGSQLLKIAEAAGLEPPHYPQPDAAGHKLPAAWLIERAGFHKGQRFGRVGLSSRHALALVCDPGATAQEVVDAARQVQRGVYAQFGVRLRPEPRFVGFEVGADGLPV